MGHLLQILWREEKVVRAYLKIKCQLQLPTSYILIHFITCRSNFAVYIFIFKCRHLYQFSQQIHNGGYMVKEEVEKLASTYIYIYNKNLKGIYIQLLERERERSYSINNGSKISSEGILVNIFAEEIIFGGNHDFGCCAS